MKKMKRILALVLTLVMVIGMAPNITLPAQAAGDAGLTVVDKINDPETLNNWQDYYGTNALMPDGTRGISTWKAGGVWTDKSVFASNQALTAANLPVSLVDGNDFVVSLSALGSNKQVVGQSTTPTDTVLVLDLFQSMDNSRSVGDMIAAANETLDTLLKMNVNNRVGVVLYSGNHEKGDSEASSAQVILPLDYYTTTTSTTQWEQVDDDWVKVTRYQYLSVSGSSDTRVSVASGTRNSNNARPNTGDKQTAGGTYIQNGLFKAWKEFESMTDKGVVQTGVQAGIQRQPILVLMSDGEPTAATTSYYNIGKSNNGNGTSSNNRIVFLTQLTAAWVKSKVGTHYNNTPAKFYTLGLGTANNANATAVLSPVGSNDVVVGYWNNFNKGSVDGENVTITGSGFSAWNLAYQTAAEAIGRNYVDMYKSADNTADLIAAFRQIVEQIGLQSAYSVTLVESGNADLDGYITIEDELGSMMQVKDVKGILMGDTLFTGAELAKSMNEGMLGQSSNPKDYGTQFVQTIKERLGITYTSVAQNLIRSAYHSDQLNYVSNSDYSNYIGWYGGANNEYLGFWDQDTGITAEGAPAGTKYINRSYIYLGPSNESHNAADMMHVIVLVRTEVANEHQTVLFKVPSSLIPMVEYKVELDGKSLETAEEITLEVEENTPIRLLYEVGLPSDVNDLNINQKVEEYLAKEGSNHIHKDDKGNYTFYANSWGADHDDNAPKVEDLTDEEKLALTAKVAESHFIPNTVNERFYIQEDTVVYVKNGNSYTPATSVTAGGTYYFPRTIIAIINGEAKAITQYEALYPATVADSSNFRRNSDGTWVILKGTIRQTLSNMELPKAENRTDTIPCSDHLWVDVNGKEPTDQDIYSFLGNNGKMTVKPTAGIYVTKDLAEVADGAQANEKFTITVTLSQAEENAGVTDAEGNALPASTWSTTDNKVFTLNLADGEEAYITGLTAGTTYTVEEAAHRKYVAAYTYENENKVVVEHTIQGITVTNTPVKPGSVYITKEVVPYKQGETFPTDVEFKVKTTFKDADGQPLANTTFKTVNEHQQELTSITTDANGVYIGGLYHGETVHIQGLPAGATVTVEEIEIPDNYNLSSYRSRNVTGQDADNDGTVTIISQSDATIVITNTYTPDPTEVKLDLDVKKTLYTDTNPEKAMSFTFVLERWDGTKWEEVLTFDVNDVIPGETNTKTGEIFNNSLGVFTEAGTHIYQVYEEIPDERIPGMSYDRTIYTLTLTVTDVNGQLVAVVKDQAGNILTDADNDGDLDFTANFRNEVDAAPVSLNIFKNVEDTSKNPQTSKDGFEFKAVQTDENWNILPNGGELTATSDGAGEARMTATYHDAGNYYYMVSEVTPDPKPAGWEYSQKVYKMQVVVTKDEQTGDLSANMIIDSVDLQTDDADITFTNTYDPQDAPVDLNLLVKKELTGRALKAGEFTFGLFENNTASIVYGRVQNLSDAFATGTNNADASVSFTSGKNNAQKGITFADGKLIFAQIGKYEYDIVEVKGDLGGVTYDSTIYDLVIEVTDDDQDGKLEVNYYFEDSTEKVVTFKNTYKVSPIEAVIEGKKTIRVISGLKTLLSGEFTFGLYNEAGEKIGETTNLANGTFKFDAIEYGSGDIGKTYTYTVKEIAPDGTTDGSYKNKGMSWSGQSFTVTVKITDNGNGTYTSGNDVYDGTIYTVLVTVADANKDGVLEITKTVNGVADGTISFTNTFVPDPIQHSLQATKTYEKGLKGNDFQFRLVSADGKTGVDQTKYNNAKGDVNFDPITFPAAGDYKFTVTEKKDDNLSYIRPSEAEYEVTITVVNESGVLRVSNVAVVNTKGTGESDLNFVNTYVMAGEDEVILRGTKTLTGDRTTVNEGEFAFGLYNAAGELVESVKNDANGNFQFSALKFTEKDVAIDGKTVETYTVKEIAGNDPQVTYDDTVYTVEITIEDNDEGGVKASYTIDGKADGKLEFTNTYTEPEPTEPTEPEPTEPKPTEPNPGTPVTGDTFPLFALVFLLAASGVAIVVLMLTKKRKGGKYLA